MSDAACRLGCCCDDPAALDEVRGHEPPPEVAALRAAGFRLLLEQGRPIPLDELAAAAGLTRRGVDEILTRPEARGRVRLDAEGRVVGIAGLSIEPTRHELRIGTTPRWAWCALDAVGILGALAADGTVASSDPHTGRPVVVDFVAGEPHGEAALFILGGYDGHDVVEEWCPSVNFFGTADDAAAWVAAASVEGDVVAVAHVAADAAEMWRPVADPVLRR